MKIRRAALALAAGALALGLAAVPALGQPGPNCPTSGTAPNSGTSTTNGGDCSVSGTITIGSQLALALDFSSFALSLSNDAGNPTGSGNVFVLSNDMHGYYVTVASTAYTSGANSIPAADVSGYIVGSGFQPLASPQTFAASSTVSGSVSGAVNSATPSGWDSYNSQGYYLNTTPNVPPGSYQGTVSYVLWAN